MPRRPERETQGGDESVCRDEKNSLSSLRVYGYILIFLVPLFHTSLDSHLLFMEEIILSAAGRNREFWEAGGISDPLIRLQERIFSGHSYICCSSVQNGQLALSGNRWDGGLQFVGFDNIIVIN